MIVVKPIKAQLYKDYDTFGTCDPYCVVQIDAQKHQTQPHDKGGKNPQWNDTLNFQTKGHTLKVQIYDKDSMSSDDLVGIGSAHIDLLLSNPGKTLNLYVALANEGQKTGKVLLELQYQGEQMGAW